MSLVLFRVRWAMVAALLLATLPLARPLFAAQTSIVVTKTLDTNTTCQSGTNCSFREAIALANTTGNARITFAIPTSDSGYDAASGVWKLTLKSAFGVEGLPTITGDGITIDGTVSGGTTPTIVLTGEGVSNSSGLLIHGSNATVRGLIISGFEAMAAFNDRYGGAAIEIGGGSSTTSNTVVEYCYLGTNATGTAVGDLTTNGIVVAGGASGTRIRNNVVSGNDSDGVVIQAALTSNTQLASNTMLTANIIGANAAGTAALPNGGDGILISGTSDGTVVGPGNTISGNSRYGIAIDRVNSKTTVANTRVIGNRIGLNSAGTAKLPNVDGGISITTSQNTRIGGPDAGDRNYISGNGVAGSMSSSAYGAGVRVTRRADADPNAPGTDTTVIENNVIGLDSAGNSIPNIIGVLLDKGAAGVVVGGDNASTGNTIAGNSQEGVQIVGFANLATASQQTRNNVVRNNQIGGTATNGNGRFGVLIRGNTPGNTITGNTISGNASAGVVVEDDSAFGASSPQSPSGTTISANKIGLRSGDDQPIGNGAGEGIRLRLGANTTTVGPGNQVAGHKADGIIISGSTTLKNRITKTTTNTNTGLGINLQSGGNGDGGTRPTISGASVTNNVASGTITNSSACGTGCTIEVFDSATNPGDEGPRFLASGTSTNGSFSINVAGCQSFLTFTITDSDGNTSKFGPVVAATCSTGTSSIDLSPASQPDRAAAPGSKITFTHYVTNTGTTSSQVNVAATSSLNWPTSVSCAQLLPATLAAGESLKCDVSVTVPNGASQSARNDITVTASLVGTSTTQTRTNSVTVQFQAGVELAPLGPSSKQAAPGQQISFTLTLTNTGDGSDSFNIAVQQPGGWSGATIQPTPPITLAAGASKTLTVTLQVPANPGAGPFDATVTATSTSNQSASASVKLTVTLKTAAAPAFDSAKNVTTAPAKAVTLTHTLSNVGQIAGTFALSASAPAGWTTSGLSATVALASGGNTAISLVVQPPATALAGNYPVTIRAANQDDPTVVAEVVDTVTISRSAALALEAPADDVRQPNSVVTYTFTLTNSGNLTDTVGLQAKASLAGWSATPISPTVAVAPGATVPVPVRLIIPAGAAAGITNTTTLTATSDVTSLAPVSASVRTGIAATPGVTLSPAQQNRNTLPGTTITSTITLQNSGSISQTYSITITNKPAGWTAVLTPTTVGPIEPGVTATLQLAITLPADAANQSSGTVTIAATTTTTPSASATASVTVTAGSQVGGSFTTPCDASVPPGTTQVCTHTLTNTGATSDTFVLYAQSSLGWDVTVSPLSVVLEPGASRDIRVSIVVPAAAAAGDTSTTFVRARSSRDDSVVAQVNDTTTVTQQGGVALAPSRTIGLQPGKVVSIAHTVTNTGNGPDSYVITATQDLNWKITLVPATTPEIARGTSYSFTVQVTVPAGVPVDSINRIRVIVISQFKNDLFADAYDVIRPLSPQGVPVTNFTYIPMISNNPGTSQ